MRHDGPPVDNQCPTPTCKKWRKGNTGALIHGLRRKVTAAIDTRRDAMAQLLFAERGGEQRIDTVTRCHVWEFARLSVQIEDVELYLAKAGTLTQAGRERAAVKHLLTLSGRRERVALLLQGTAPVESRPPTTYDDLDDEALILRVESLLENLRARRNDTRPIDLTTMTDVPVTTRATEDDRITLGDQRSDDAALVTPDPPAPAREVACEFGCGTLARCHEIKTTQPDTWQALHDGDPKK